MGDNTGVFSYSINDNGTTKSITGIPCFMGLKNDYKYLGAICEDVLISNNADYSQSVYIDHNIDGHTFDISSAASHVCIGNTPGFSAKDYYYIMRNNLMYACDFPLECGASSNTGYGDAYYCPGETSGLRGAYRLGRASHGPYAGSVFLHGHLAPSAAYAHCGAVLCEFKEPMTTEPQWCA